MGVIGFDGESKVNLRAVGVRDDVNPSGKA